MDKGLKATIGELVDGGYLAVHWIAESDAGGPGAFWGVLHLPSHFSVQLFTSKPSDKARWLHSTGLAREIERDYKAAPEAVA